MDGLGISTASTSKAGKRDASKRLNGDRSSSKGKHASEPPTTYTVSKIDAGQAVLISDQIHCIEFPSILLPPGCSTGSVVSISCTRNVKEERVRSDEFWDLQDDILSAFGERSPAPPRLRLRNVTQTSVTLEWDRLELATAKLLSLTIWRNGQRLAAIPNPLNNTSTKVSGLDVDAPYSFHLIMRTTAGTFASQTIKTRTLTLTDTSGIAVCFGAIDPPELVEEAKQALSQMRARWSNRIQIETTHFVCTHPSGPSPAVTPPAGSPQELPDAGTEFQRAAQLSIPIVRPSWVLACMNEHKMVPISAHYLDKTALTGGPSTTSLAKSGSGRAQQPLPQQPREGPREAIQLQKPPPPKNGSPEVPSTSTVPGATEIVQTQEQIEQPPPPAAKEEEAERATASEAVETTSSSAPEVAPESTTSTTQEAAAPESEATAGQDNDEEALPTQVETFEGASEVTNDDDETEAAAEAPIPVDAPAVDVASASEGPTNPGGGAEPGAEEVDEDDTVEAVSAQEEPIESPTESKARLSEDKEDLEDVKL